MLNTALNAVRDKKTNPKSSVSVEKIDFYRFCLYVISIRKMMEIKMFDDIFNFVMERNLKQSIGFYLFYGCLFMGVSGLITMLGF